MQITHGLACRLHSVGLVHLGESHCGIPPILVYGDGWSLVVSGHLPNCYHFSYFLKQSFKQIDVGKFLETVIFNPCIWVADSFCSAQHF